MSVRTGDRSEGKLQVLNQAKELRKYSIIMVKAEKRFPKSTRWLYANPIATEIRGACTCIRKANSIYVSKENKRDFKLRHLEQMQAVSHLAALWDLIEDSYESGYISSSQVEHWTELLDKTERLLRSWISSDLDRITNMP